MRKARAGGALVQHILGGQLAFGQTIEALEVALVLAGLAATLLAQVALRVEARAGFFDPRLQVILAQAHEYVAGLHPLPGVDQQLADLAAGLERQVGTPAGLHGTGTGVGHQGFHRAIGHFHQLHGDGLGAHPESRQHQQGCQNRNNYQ
ncbi:hypothetical protein D3C72_1603480 [compost metagenome]